MVTATATSDGTTYTDTTDASGNYLIDVPQNDSYTVTVGTPAGTTPSSGSADSDVSDATTENNKSHDGAGTSVTVTTVDNLTLDFGFTSLVTPPSSSTQPPNSIPTLSEWAMILLMMMLGFVGYRKSLEMQR